MQDKSYRNKTPFDLAVVLILLLGSLVVVSHAAGETILHQKMDRPQESYMLGLVQLALGYSGGQFQYQESTDAISKARLVEMVKEGSMSVMWTGASEAMEAQLIPVRIPAYKGLMGHRIFIIRKNDQARFNTVTSLEDLREIKMGQGRTWADTKILESANMHIIKTLKTEGLFWMLDGARFDAFPRGVHEPWTEVSSRPHLELTVEKNLVLKYMMPYYIYVTPGKHILAKQITQGLESAIADGTFDRYFFSDPQVKSALELSKLKDRRIYSIDNPNLPKSTPVNRPELWLDISSL